MAHVSHKLNNSFEGALAGGGDPATSPLYVFGPFLKLIVVAGVASVTFGASVWLVIATIAMVSAMYRLVMNWVTDGSGGSGLSEEEFGGWAVKVNAAITFIEYTLTFLVSMAAMVTFIADRFIILNETVLGIQYRTFVAILLSILTGWLVNRGPKTAARAFGPATAGVLVLLWAMIGATIWRQGLRLPNFNLRAFTPQFIQFTFGGFARMLAVMTGIEVFANLVAAYEGSGREKSNKAFGSLLIIMGSTSVTMLVVGPAIHNIADLTNEHVSVFTQTMDQLLPAPLPFLGTLIGIVVLLSASAASAQGLQNLALGLKDRHYVPAFIGQRNRFEVADKPVWIEVGLCCLCFLAFGTREETYLAIYAAGVFILLSMTGWAVAKRLVRQVREAFALARVVLIVGTILAALLTTGATVIIFQERFFEGAWTYFLFIPILYAIFSYYRRTLGDPSPTLERLGQLEKAMWGGFGFGQAAPALVTAGPVAPVAAPLKTGRQPAPPAARRLPDERVVPRHILIPLDGSPFAEYTLPVAEAICKANDARLTLLSVLRVQSVFRRVAPAEQMENGGLEASRTEQKAYLRQVAERMRARGVEVSYVVSTGPVAETIHSTARSLRVELVIISTHRRSDLGNWIMSSIAGRIIQLTTTPLMVVRPVGEGYGQAPPPQIKRLLVPMDGSEFAERALVHARGLATSFGSEILLLTVPEVPEAERYGLMADLVAEMRAAAEIDARQYLESIAIPLREEGLNVQTLVTGSDPVPTIVSVSEAGATDLVMLTTRGRGGGANRLFVGSVAEQLMSRTHRLLYLVPVHNHRAPGQY